MRERRSVDRGIEARRLTAPACEALSAATLARYVTRSIPKEDRGAVDEHLRDCDECRAVVETTCTLLTRI